MYFLLSRPTILSSASAFFSASYFSASAFFLMSASSFFSCSAISFSASSASFSRRAMSALADVTSMVLRCSSFWISYAASASARLTSESFFSSASRMDREVFCSAMR